MALEGLQLGQYRLIRLLGKGGMGEVYLAEDERINQQVAIKISSTEASAYPSNDVAKDATRLFQREAKAIARLDHPHILPLYSYSEENINGMVLTYIIMPFRPEGSFANWLQQHTATGLLSIQDVAFFISQAADALQYAHDNQIIHQDVKPPNFLIRTNKENPGHPDLLLADFGIAKFSSASASVSHASRGTPRYMAPEQWSGDPVYATDQYALAVLAYELLAGVSPFTGRSEQMMYQHISVQPKPPSTFNPRLSKGIDEIILKALSKQPENRFPSISAFAHALQQATDYTNTPTMLRFPAKYSDKTVPISYSKPTPETILPGSNNDSGRKAAISNPEPLPSNGIPDPQKKPILRGRNLALVGLVLLIVIASLGFYYIPKLFPSTPNNDTVATVHANDATSFAATATRQSHNTFITVTTQSASPTPKNTATVILTTVNPYSPNTGTLVLNDLLHDNNQGYNWDTAPTQFGTCTFTAEGYHVAAPGSSTYHRCMAQNTNFTNFAYEVDMTIIAGDCGAIIFRGNASLYHYYYFRICQDGTYMLWLYSHSGNESQDFLQSSDPIIHQGTGQTNLIAVVANNNSINLYVNHKAINAIQDSTYNQGQIGLAADNNNNPTEVVFTNAKVWTL